MYEAIEDADDSTGKPVITDIHTIADNSNKAVVLTLVERCSHRTLRHRYQHHTYQYRSTDATYLVSSSVEKRREAIHVFYYQHASDGGKYLKLTNGKEHQHINS